VVSYICTLRARSVLSPSIVVDYAKLVSDNIRGDCHKLTDVLTIFGRNRLELAERNISR